MKAIHRSVRIGDSVKIKRIPRTALVFNSISCASEVFKLTGVRDRQVVKTRLFHSVMGNLCGASSVEFWERVGVTWQRGNLFYACILTGLFRILWGCNVCVYHTCRRVMRLRWEVLTRCWILPLRNRFFSSRILRWSSTKIDFISSIRHLPSVPRGHSTQTTPC